MLLPNFRIAVGAMAALIDVSLANAFPLKDAADYEVKRHLLEKAYPAYNTFKGQMHAGLMPAALPGDPKAAGGDYSSYFFWLFQPEGDSTDEEEGTPESFRDDTLLVWFNGGPGCSSMVGLIGEMGPVGIPKFGPGIPAPNPATLMDAPLVQNEYAWTKKSSMLFVEQPGGTGFSTASSEWTGEEAEKRVMDDVADAFYAFLQNVYAVFGDELAKKKLYLSGESFAGMYIPTIARGLHLGNKHVLAQDEGYRSPSLRIVNIRGLAIGNGWIDPDIQGSTTIDFAWWHGMIDLNTYRGLHQKWDECMKTRNVGSDEEPFHPFTTPDECGVSIAVMESSGSTFMYDVTTYDAYPAVLNVGGSIYSFFNDPMVRESLNAPSLADHPEWTACVPGSGRRRRLESQSQRELLLLDQSTPVSVVPYIAELLDDAGLDILLYNGDLDLACSSQSTELALESMEWSGKDKWLNPDVTKWQQWNVDGQPAGHTKKHGKLQFLVVYNSGHFVPINQARNSLNMIGRLLDGDKMGDQKLPQFPARPVKAIDGAAADDTHSQREAPTGKGTHSLSLLTGLCGFLLGVLASHLLSKRTARHHYRVSSSDSPFYQGTTEATPLHHMDA